MDRGTVALALPGGSVMRIQPFHWSSFYTATGQPNAFQAGHEGPPLRITLDADLARESPAEDDVALTLVREFRLLSTVDVIASDVAPDMRSIRLLSEDGELFSDAGSNENDRRWSRESLGPARGSRNSLYSHMWPELMSPRTTEEEQDLYVRLMAHDQLNRDIYVSRRPRLLAAADAPFLNRINLRTPEETCAIVGLYLRSFGDFSYYWDGLIASMDRRSFYTEAARSALPASRTFVPALRDVGTLRNPPEWDVLGRYIRALQARDLIAIRYYRADPYDSLFAPEGSGYHLDYLALLLSGAVDAFTRVIHSTMKIHGTERSAALHHGQYQKRLRAGGAGALVDVVLRDEHAAFLDLLHYIRNTIHSSPIREQQRWNDDRDRIFPPEEISEAILGAFAQLGGVEYWGVDLEDQRYGLKLHPFPLARQLTRYGGRLLDELMSVASTLIELRPVPSRGPRRAGGWEAPSFPERIRLLAGVGD